MICQVFTFWPVHFTILYYIYLFLNQSTMLRPVSPVLSVLSDIPCFVRSILCVRSTVSCPINLDLSAILLFVLWILFCLIYSVLSYLSFFVCYNIHCSLNLVFCLFCLLPPPLQFIKSHVPVCLYLIVCFVSCHLPCHLSRTLFCCFVSCQIHCNLYRTMSQSVYVCFSVLSLATSLAICLEPCPSLPISVFLFCLLPPPLQLV